MAAKENLYGTSYPAGVVNGPYELPNLTPEAPGWGAWLNNMGKYFGNPFVSPAGSADEAGMQRAALGNYFDPNTYAPSAREYDPAIFGGGRDPNAWADQSQIYGFAGAPGANVIGPRSSAFGFEPGGFGEGGYGNEFVPSSAPATAGAPTEKAAETASATGGPASSAAPSTEPGGVYQDPNAPRPPENVPEFPAARRAPNGREPEAFIIHHTSGRGDPASVVADWKQHRPGIGTQYIMDRNGVIHDVAAEFNYHGTNHTKSGNIPGAIGLNNSNVVGMEIIALNDKDVTASQIAALKQFAEARYSHTPFYGHGEVASNKEADEGRTGANAILDARPPLFQFNWDNAPIPGPVTGAASAVPPRFGFMGTEPSSALPTSTGWSPFPGFRESTNFENRSAEQLPPEQSAALQTRGFGYDPGPEVAPTPLGTALGLEDIGRTLLPRLPM